MRHLTFAAGILLVVLPSTSFVSGEGKPRKNTTPLSADEIAIYKTLLRQYASTESRSLNVAARTYPLDPESQRNGFKNSECLNGIQLDNLSTVSLTYHELTSDVLPGQNMKLVDAGKQSKIVHGNDPDKTMREGKSVDSAVKDAFATALFSMSEIGFDKDHRHAVVSYRFWCGTLCGNGSTLVFEKAGNEWKKTKRNCGGWIS
jgi:hypothetical protein